MICNLLSIFCTYPPLILTDHPNQQPSASISQLRISGNLPESVTTSVESENQNRVAAQRQQNLQTHSNESKGASNSDMHAEPKPGPSTEQGLHEYGFYSKAALFIN